jgi:F-type H+-transporting ATPase subunit b
MQETLQQLGGLLLGSIPTIILLMLLFGCYLGLVHAPLQRVLGERRQRTEGAMERARADIAAAEAKAAEYEARLREARLAVFRAAENRRRLAQESRAEAVADARARAHAQVKKARASLEQDKETAKVSLHGESERLAKEIIRTILKPRATAGSPVAGGPWS